MLNAAKTCEKLSLQDTHIRRRYQDVLFSLISNVGAFLRCTNKHWLLQYFILRFLFIPTSTVVSWRVLSVQTGLTYPIKSLFYQGVSIWEILFCLVRILKFSLTHCLECFLDVIFILKSCLVSGCNFCSKAFISALDEFNFQTWFYFERDYHIFGMPWSIQIEPDKNFYRR